MVVKNIKAGSGITMGQSKNELKVRDGLYSLSLINLFNVQNFVHCLRLGRGWGKMITGEKNKGANKEMKT